MAGLVQALAIVDLTLQRYHLLLSFAQEWLHLSGQTYSRAHGERLVKLAQKDSARAPSSPPLVACASAMSIRERSPQHWLGVFVNFRPQLQLEARHHRQRPVSGLRGRCGCCDGCLHRTGVRNVSLGTGGRGQRGRSRGAGRCSRCLRSSLCGTLRVRAGLFPGHETKHQLGTCRRAPSGGRAPSGVNLGTLHGGRQPQHC